MRNLEKKLFARNNFICSRAILFLFLNSRESNLHACEQNFLHKKKPSFFTWKMPLRKSLETYNHTDSRVTFFYIKQMILLGLPDLDWLLQTSLQHTHEQQTALLGLYFLGARQAQSMHWLVNYLLLKPN